MIISLASLLESLPKVAHVEVIESIEAIFFETSTRKTFASVEDRHNFLYRYLGVYFKNPTFCFLALNPDLENLTESTTTAAINTHQNKMGTFIPRNILGYLVGTPVTTKEHYELHPYLELFRSHIDQRYPSHLHINFTQAARGKGTGSSLIAEFERALTASRSPGVHLITSTFSRNVTFYEKNNYQRVLEIDYQNSSLLMLGKIFPTLQSL